MAANAVYGLYLMNPERHMQALRTFVAHGFRRSAAALAGRLDPAIREPLLKPLLTDPDASVRRAAFQTLAAIKSAPQAAA